MTAASIKRVDDEGIPQLIHYDEGVGTGRLDQFRGGTFGTGLTENIREAYRFLIFNYDPGDEIFVFGFSRGAFTARSFVGFIRHVGPLHRLHAGRIDEALQLYRERNETPKEGLEALRKFRADFSDKVCIGEDDDAWRCKNINDYSSGDHPLMRIAYVGVWDTVGALGVPKILPFSKYLNRDHSFHDPSIDSFVRSARHAVAIDERRRFFPPDTFMNVGELNAAAGFSEEDEDAPYQERWFPGVHGSVGGGGDIRGLSDDALGFVLEGAKDAGLVLDTGRGTRIHGFMPNPLAPLVNESKPEKGFTHLISGDRVGPSKIWQLSRSAKRRWRTKAEKLGGKPYRPAALSNLEEELEKLGPWDFTPPEDLVTTHIVLAGDSLSKIARQCYGDATLWPEIFDANRDRVLNPDEIFPGQELRIPHLPETAVNGSEEASRC